MCRRGSTRERSRPDGTRTTHGSGSRLHLTRTLRWPISGVAGETVSRANAGTHSTNPGRRSSSSLRVPRTRAAQELLKNLKNEVVRSADTSGCKLRRETADITDTPIDFRFLQLLLTAEGDPKFHLGDFSLGVRVGQGARLPRLPALYPAKKRWRLSEQRGPRNYL